MTSFMWAEVFVWANNPEKMFFGWFQYLLFGYIVHNIFFRIFICLLFFSLFIFDKKISPFLLASSLQYARQDILRLTQAFVTAICILGEMPFNLLLALSHKRQGRAELKFVFSYGKQFKWAIKGIHNHPADCISFWGG